MRSEALGEMLRGMIGHVHAHQVDEAEYWLICSYPVAFDEEEGALFYEKVPGIALGDEATREPKRLAEQLGHFLSVLHALAPGRLEDLVALEPDAVASSSAPR